MRIKDKYAEIWRESLTLAINWLLSDGNIKTPFDDSFLRQQKSKTSSKLLLS